MVGSKLDKHNSRVLNEPMPGIVWLGQMVGSNIDSFWVNLTQLAGFIPVLTQPCDEDIFLECREGLYIFNLTG